jgi:tRNA(Ile)-lysidine synthase
MFQAGDVVVLAVSGGPDSICMLHSLRRLRRLFRLQLICFHFDHLLRADSSADARYVARQAAQLGVPFVLRRAEQRPARGESVEAWARTARYRALSELREELGARVAAVGHTADDQAETVLLALLRGGGLEALAAMSPVSAPIVRPLLDVSRAETVSFCRSVRLRPRHDPMNEDLSLLRAALRHRVLPVLERAMDGRGVRGPLLRTAELLRDDADLLHALAHEAEARVLEHDGDDILLRSEPLTGLPRSLSSRIVRSVLLESGILPEARLVDAVLELAGGRPGRRASLPGGLLARSERRYVRVSQPSPAGGAGARRSTRGRGS